MVDHWYGECLADKYLPRGVEGGIRILPFEGMSLRLVGGGCPYFGDKGSDGHDLH